jgi:hypothetical protein
MAGFPGPNATYTLAQALTVARNFDVVAAYYGSFRPFVAQMKAANPKLKLLAYINSSWSNLTNGYPSSWFAHDASGKLVTATAFPNTAMLDLTNTAWRDNVAHLCTMLRGASGYAGCFLDVMGPAALAPNYGSALPIDPDTGQAWTAAELMADTGRIAAAVEAANPGVPVAGNGIISGPMFYDPTAPTSVVATAVPNGMAETWFRSATMAANQYRVASRWIEDVNMVRDAEARGHPVLVTVKLWQPATQQQIDSVHMFSLASFLLSTSGASAYSFSSGCSQSQLYQTSSLDHLDIGKPTAPYRQAGGAYERTFSNGLVLANPTSSSVAVQLGGTYRTGGGATVTSVTLAPDSGDVLIKA